MKNEDLPAIQIYGQHAWHGEAKIVGNRAGLEALRDQINKALKWRKDQGENYFPSDGEGYSLTISFATDEQLDRLPCWYQAHYANPDKADHYAEMERRIFELEAALRKVRIHNATGSKSQFEEPQATPSAQQGSEVE